MEVHDDDDVLMDGGALLELIPDGEKETGTGEKDAMNHDNDIITTPEAAEAHAK